MREAMIRRTLAGNNPAVGCPRSLEWRKKIAQRMSEGRMGYRASKHGKYKRKDGRTITFRSTWECLTAQYMDALDWEWEYEKQVYTLGQEVYIPDFLIYCKGVLERVVEVKGYYPTESQERMGRFTEMFAAQGVTMEVWDLSRLLELNILPPRWWHMTFKQ
jgi:hypothetical protein